MIFPSLFASVVGATPVIDGVAGFTVNVNEALPAANPVTAGLASVFAACSGRVAVIDTVPGATRVTVEPSMAATS